MLNHSAPKTSNEVLFQSKRKENLHIYYSMCEIDKAVSFSISSFWTLALKVEIVQISNGWRDVFVTIVFLKTCQFTKDWTDFSNNSDVVSDLPFEPLTSKNSIKILKRFMILLNSCQVQKLLSLILTVPTWISRFSGVKKSNY